MSRKAILKLELPEASMERLERLRAAVEGTSYAEVLKDALRLYEHVVKLHDDGQSLYQKTADGQFEPVTIFS